MPEAFQLPWVTKIGHEVNALTREDGVGFPVIERLMVTHKDTATITDLGKEHYPIVRHILMTGKIAEGAYAQAELAQLPLAGMSEAALLAALRYDTAGVSAHRKKAEALHHMAASLETEGLAKIELFLNDVDAIVNGRDAELNKLYDRKSQALIAEHFGDAISGLPPRAPNTPNAPSTQQR